MFHMIRAEWERIFARTTRVQVGARVRADTSRSTFNSKQREGLRRVPVGGQYEALNLPLHRPVGERAAKSKETHLNHWSGGEKYNGDASPPQRC